MAKQMHITGYAGSWMEKGWAPAGLSPTDKLVEILDVLEDPRWAGQSFHPEIASPPMDPHLLAKASAGFARAHKKTRPGKRTGKRNQQA